ncbi:hypothetical protein CJ030_MR0G008561 [Morella rubra]|uniref:Uncharacterized protein n=1 Tax=Morella rubra TaxID=262757 RepID=A0A6A1UII6_9ROSI|nr:hypothetical protein CJ030_MR0G008561 [Morella rubra]
MEQDPLPPGPLATATLLACLYHGSHRAVSLLSDTFGSVNEQPCQLKLSPELEFPAHDICLARFHNQQKHSLQHTN